MTGGGERLRALLIAPPGAGKGTQAERLSQHFGVSHISTGDVFRHEVAAGTKLGRQVKGYLDAGDLVPDPVVGEVVRQQIMRALRETGGYLLDGFPRTVPQAEAAYALASELGITAHAVLTFLVPRAVLLERLMGRGSDGGRTDDDATTIRHRLDVYDAQTAPLLDYYTQRGLLVPIDADRPPDEVTADSIVALERALAAGSPVPS
ncbi:MAG TPA: adenylate kinase [Acidimicrobiales bacterium]